MKKLLRRMPGHVGLWVPLLALPLLISDLWLHVFGQRVDLGTTLSLAGAMTLFGW